MRRSLDHLEDLLKEFQDVFPEDQQRHPQMIMRIPIKQGSKPPHQAPYRVPPGANSTIRQTLECLEEHGLVNLSHCEYAAPVV